MITPDIKVYRVYLPYIVQAPATVQPHEIATQLYLEFVEGMRLMRPYKGIRIRRDQQATRQDVDRLFSNAEVLNDKAPAV